MANLLFLPYVSYSASAELYASYESADLWPLLHSPPQGLKVDFVRAEGSTFRWGGPDESRIASYGHTVHVLRNSGHWVHTDNPRGLYDIMAPSFHFTSMQRPHGLH
jgi:hypothetical protein